jgi:hypothetical protein
MVTHGALSSEDDGELPGEESAVQLRNHEAHNDVNKSRRKRRTRIAYVCVAISVAMMVVAGLTWMTWAVAGPVVAVPLASTVIYPAMELALGMLRYITE